MNRIGSMTICNPRSAAEVMSDAGKDIKDIIAAVAQK